MKYTACKECDQSWRGDVVPVHTFNGVRCPGSPAEDQPAPAGSNADRFIEVLTAQYVDLFKTEEYAYAAQTTTPEALAGKMTVSLARGAANKDGTGIKRTCKALGIKHTYQAIREYLIGGASRG